MSQDDKTYTEESKIVFHEGEWQVHVLKRWLRYNFIEKRWQDEKTETEYRGLETWHPNGLHKRIDGEILIRREAISEQTLRPMHGFFVQKIRVEADSGNPNEYVSQFKDGFYVHWLDVGVSTPLSIRDQRIKLVGNEKRLTDKEAEQKIKEGLSVFSDFGKTGLVRELVT